MARRRKKPSNESSSSKFIVRRPAELPGVEIFYFDSAELSSLRHLHEDFRFGVALNGRSRTRYRGENLVVAPGQLQLAQPGEISSCEPEPLQRQAFRGIVIPAERMARIAADLYGSRRGSPFFRNHMVKNREAEAHFLHIHERLMAPTSALERSSVLQGLVTLILRRFAADRTESPPVRDAPQAVRAARDYIEDNISANPSLEELSTIAGLSPYHLSRLFRRSFGLPPHAYQNHLRIQKSKALLAEGEPSDEVAALLGFSDQSHFIRLFKRQIGVTPHVYRNGVSP